ncbi:hypothetical protein [Pseudomonas weihenstephanensis]|uniref:hypothetical protein n=1 Tax=Pseudomonas weihenstephanensis TaxID=1608994 RepID=UPI00193B98AA|nr:hypothetical protein [Pseudomonas weihenstephanensis]MBM1189375.1 hypothetical protein [Pseudomonas weihenstephanensis]
MTPLFAPIPFGLTELYNTQLREEQTATKTKSIKVPSFGKPVSSLRFLATVPRFSVCDGDYRFRVERCEFSLGLGPCGRTVTALWYRADGDFLTIIQECAPHECGKSDVKEFVYLIREITGRVEATSV